ncbi:Enoyl-CoA hydratase [Lentibacillus halodurans]|uniref:Enoyl-CoA hydratase n=1 Tax=Lentibacillus halodurans TaxID=237679 RepID=A0A1I0YFN4_9BACI|nr:enoyl-CoA hydratase [Lentibacillus halodurans]SFB11992.1 Enoyl-CoA hydratase [Lentibacillus halodurans]
MTLQGNEHLLSDKKEGVLYLTLNRPDTLNAFSPEMITGLKEAIHQAGSDERIRTIVISGSGRAFSAGGDVKTMGKQPPLDVYDHIGELNELIIAMKDFGKPIIAAVHGFAAGAGFNLALACDMILAAEDSNFVLSFAKVGLISDGGGLYFLPRLVGQYRAKELLLSAEPISAEKAHSLGIVNHTYPLDEFQDKVHAFAVKIASGPLTALGFMKKIADQSDDSDLEAILEQERITQATLVSTEDHQEGVQAFKEKREPNFNRG